MDGNETTTPWLWTDRWTSRWTTGIGGGQVPPGCGASCGPKSSWKYIGRTPCRACRGHTRNTTRQQRRGPARGRLRDAGSSGRPQFPVGSRKLSTWFRGVDDRAIGRPRHRGRAAIDLVSNQREPGGAQGHGARRPSNRTGSGRGSCREAHPLSNRRASGRGTRCAAHRRSDPTESECTASASAAHRPSNRVVADAGAVRSGGG